MAFSAADLQKSIDGSFKRKYDEALDYLDNNYAYFLTYVLNMGKPEWRSDIETAAVAPADGVSVGKVVQKKGNFRYLFNPKFAEMLSVEEVAFVQAHETMHIIFEHLTLGEKFDSRFIFNIAADCVINDYLHNMGLVVPDSCMRGMPNVGYDCANATVAQVYDDLKDKIKEMEKQNGEGSYSPNGEHWDDHSWMEGLTDEQKQAMADIANGGTGQESVPQDIQDSKDADKGKAQKSVMAGTGFGGSYAFTEKHGVNMKWAELLKEINPDVFKPWGPPPRPSYHRPRRKMMAFYPKVTLPVSREIDKTGKGEGPAIVMALDTSGSIGVDDANRFVNLARSIPQNKIKLFVCTFTTRYLELDLEEPTWESGGTCFSCIEDFVNEKAVPELKHYPKSVVVITDGYAGFGRSRPAKEHEDRWHWLLTEGGQMGHYGDTNFGKVHKLTDFANGTKL